MFEAWRRRLCGGLGFRGGRVCEGGNVKALGPEAVIRGYDEEDSSGHQPRGPFSVGGHPRPHACACGCACAC